MATVKKEITGKSGETFAAAWAIRQRAHQPILHWDPPSTSQQAANASGDAVFRFGRFCILPWARQLLSDEQPVELGSRAFDLLMVLIGAPGILIPKKEIMSRVWPGRLVEESNLKMQMSALRRVLNADRDIIKTVHGRGYVFTSEVTTASIKRDVWVRPSSGSVLPQIGPVLPTSLSGWGSARRQRGAGSQIVGPEDNVQSVVAVIDDDPEIREALRRLLRAAGLCVELFSSVQEWLDSLPSDPPGCMVLDVELPGKSGLELQEELAKAKLSLPIIFISGHADVPMSVLAMKRGAIEFLTKPVQSQDLLDAVERAIVKGRARRNAEQAVAEPSSLPWQPDDREPIAATKFCQVQQPPQ
jgi:FixJ family two-component response regulator/DNA-binding winged helix-turn-helix (wHTH) protein